MKFKICRASNGYWDEPKPCDGAFAEDAKWMIEIATLEELMALEKAVGTLIIGSDGITIYDDYVE
jgi:hypothetical protein